MKVGRYHHFKAEETEAQLSHLPKLMSDGAEI